MSDSVFLKAIRDRIRLILISGAALAGLTLLVVPIYTSMAPQLENLLDIYPPEFLVALGVEDMSSVIGFLDAELFSFMFPIVAIGLGIVMGVAAVAGEEDARTINMLLAHPITRAQMAWAKVAAMIALLGLTGALILASLMIATAIWSLEISFAGLFAASLMTSLLGIFFGGVAFAVGSATGRPGLAIGIAAVSGLVAWLVDAFAPLIDGLEEFQRLSPMYWYTGTNPLSNGIDPFFALLMAATAAALLAVGVKAFERRDIAV